MIYRFSQFVFDSDCNTLRRGHNALSIRPKTAQVLQYLLENRQHLVTKRDLFEAVWGHDCVEDHALFQLISEIRQLTGDKACITTLPNRGYRWVWPVREGARPAWMGTPLAVGFGLAAVWLGIWLLPVNATRPVLNLNRGQDLPVLSASPAMAAVARAIELRTSGEIEQARVYLEVAVAANPQFAAAKLELAQTLRMLGRHEAAQRHAYDALSDARIIGDGYLEATAHVVLSQLRWLEGDLRGAIELNSRAAAIADDLGYVCAAQVSAAWQQQLTLAFTRSPDTSLPHSPEASLTACVDALSNPGEDASGMSNSKERHPADRDHETLARYMTSDHGYAS